MEQILLLHSDNLLVLCREKHIEGRGFRNRRKFVKKKEHLGGSTDLNSGQYIG